MVAPTDPSEEACPISHPLGNVIGFALGALIIFLFMATYSVDWGVGWVIWVPALLALLPATALMRRRVLWRRGNRFDLESGWLLRRAHSFPAQDLQLELLPTAGLWAVVVHHQQYAWPIATWVTKRRAERIMATLDRAAAAPPEGWPRWITTTPKGDR